MNRTEQNKLLEADPRTREPESCQQALIHYSPENRAGFTATIKQLRFEGHGSNSKALSWPLFALLFFGYKLLGAGSRMRYNQEMASPHLQCVCLCVCVCVCVCWGEVWAGSLGLDKLMTPVPALGHDMVSMPVPTGRRRRVLSFTLSPTHPLTFIIISCWECWD